MRVAYVRNSSADGDQREGEPQAGLDRADVRQRVWQAAAQLPAGDRRILLMRELEGLSYARIAEATHLSPDKVRRVLHRARVHFRRLYARQISARDTPIKCRRLGDLLSGHHDGELLGLDRRRAAEHLADCVDCQNALDKLASTSELLATLVPTPAPPGLADRLFAQGGITVVRPLTGAAGTLWRLPLMLIVGGAFIAAVVAIIVFLWNDEGASTPGLVPVTTQTPTPTATATPSPTAAPTRSPTELPVLTPAATPLPQETITPTPGPSPTASPSPTATETPEATATATPPPTVTPTPTPLAPTPSPTPTEPPPPPTGGVRGSVVCQGEAVVGASVLVTGPSPSSATPWSGVTGGGGTFDSGLALAPGSYIVTVSSPGAGYDSLLASVPVGGYAELYAQCTTVHPRP